MKETIEEIRENTKDWPFARLFGHATGILNSCEYFEKAEEKQERIDYANRLLQVVWEKHLKED